MNLQQVKHKQQKHRNIVLAAIIGNRLLSDKPSKTSKSLKTTCRGRSLLMTWHVTWGQVLDEDMTIMIMHLLG